ncbi:MAG TPA: choice-of-anchor tandem repeat GloVer-containing protein [Bryobacteraceae bacterium]|nr:choice-of-anchor tandem repeat GloVer-containing protein [Bryobacteraceae bacterium]
MPDRRKPFYCVRVLAIAGIVVFPAWPQTLTNLVTFDGSNGAACYGSLLQGTDGYFYGTTSLGGAYNHGTIFKMDSTGTLTTLHSFRAADGQNPYAVLIQSTDGNFYGTTWIGGADSRGTVFRMTPQGVLTTLHSFDGTDGSFPTAPLLEATNGNFYGVTESGGNRCGTGSCGTIFEITPAGELTTLVSFDGHNGEQPYSALIQGTDGNLYGTTAKGGGQGSVFRMTLQGTLTTLHRFNGTGGANPFGGLAQGLDGELYGTTMQGGANPCPPYIGCGTIFRISTHGAFFQLHSFDGSDGKYPEAAMTLASDGNFYGITSEGSWIFQFTQGGALTTLPGTASIAPLIQGTDGKFYGTSTGSVFSLDTGLGPFVKTLPTSGKVGTAVTILGTTLTGATSVTFNGTPAAFTVVSATRISTAVPTGASSGAVSVSTPGGNLRSNPGFLVRP